METEAGGASAAGHRAGYAAIVGFPNAGKSTLLNAWLEFPLSIVTAKPQTTRHKILGIVNGKDWQLCLLDTPGWLDRAKDRLQASLRQAAASAVRDEADVVILLVEPYRPSAEELAAARAFAAPGKPLLLAVNKCDTEKDETRRKAAAEAYSAELPVSKTFFVSALTGKGIKGLLQAAVESLPESPAYFPKDQASDRWERFFVCEAVRREIFELYHQEIPHAAAVVIETFKERPGRKPFVEVVVYVEREPQKGILIGKRGEAIRDLRRASEKGIRDVLGRPVELEIRVKVRKDWRKDPGSVKEFGYLGASFST